jgi:hypothetical protein
MQTTFEHAAELETNQSNLRSQGMDPVTSDFNLPLDICDWVPPATLKSWVQEETHALNETGVGTDIPRSLLAILAFAYARGIFDTEEILSLCESDAVLRSLCEGLSCSLEQVLNARRKDRGLLVTITVRLLTRAVVQKFNLSPQSLPPILKRRLHESAVDRLDNARHMDRGGEA